MYEPLAYVSFISFALLVLQSEFKKNLQVL